MTIDERLEFLRQSTDSLHSSVQALYETVAKQAEITAVHEQRWEKFRNVLRAGLAEFLADNGDGGGPDAS